MLRVFSISFCNKAPLSDSDVRLISFSYRLFGLFALMPKQLVFFFSFSLKSSDFRIYHSGLTFPHTCHVLSQCYHQSLFLGLLLFWGSVFVPCFHLLLRRLLLHKHRIFFACFFVFVVSLWVFIISFFNFFSYVLLPARHSMLCLFALVFSSVDLHFWNDFFSFSCSQSYYPPLSFPINIHAVLWHVMWLLWCLLSRLEMLGCGSSRLCGMSPCHAFAAA